MMASFPVPMMASAPVPMMASVDVIARTWAGATAPLTASVVAIATASLEDLKPFPFIAIVPLIILQLVHRPKRIEIDCY
jgi:hypothetical protein